MSKIYLVEEKSGLGIFTIDFILLLVFALTIGLNIILAFFAAILASVVLFLLMKIPYFGRVIVCACGVVSTMCIYGVLDIFGWMTKLRENHPVQWWITIILGGLLVIFLHWISCPSPRSNGTILGDDDEPVIIPPSVPVYNYTPSDSIQNRYEGSTNSGAIKIKLDDIIGTFNKTQARFNDITGRVDDYGEYDDLPDEFIEVSSTAIKKYNVLESRMRSYMDLFNESSDSWRSEVGADILEKAEAANAAIEQMESALRLLSQSTDKDAHSEASFFRGCDTLEALNKRYRNLAKTFHPDLEAGDEETMKLVNEEYERLKSEFASKIS